MSARALDSQRSEWFESAMSHVNRDRLIDLLSQMIEIESPTGAERPLAEMLARRLTSGGVDASVDVMAYEQANVAAVLPGRGDGPSLLLYAPMDTYLYGDPGLDIPEVGDDLRFDMLPVATVIDDLVIGLGASNPKGQAACIVAAAEAVHRAGIPLEGELLIGLGAGGMPTGHAELGRPERAHGAGCAHLLDGDFDPDMAIIAKPSKGVVWEEVGLAWLRLSARGAHSYAGTRHRGSYRNPILMAPEIIQRLEEFFQIYTRETTQGQVSPQANVTAVHAGWSEKLAFIPARCDFYVDMRLSPHEPVERALKRWRQIVSDIGSSISMDIEQSVLTVVPGTATSEDSWIVRSAIRAWEHSEGEAHVSPAENSGTTDAHVLRSRGIPTARMGAKRSLAPSPLPDDFSAGMNSISVSEMQSLVAKLIYVAIDTCTRKREEVLN